MLRNYLKTAFRLIRRNRLHTFINVVGLGVGTGTVILIMLYVTHEVSYDRHYSSAESIYRVVRNLEINGRPAHSARTQAPLGPAMKDEIPGVEEWVRLRVPDSRFTVQYRDKSFYEKGFFVVDSTFFDVFKHEMISGDSDTALDTQASVVISDVAARKYFGSADPMGEVIRADFTQDLVVTGVFRKEIKPSHLDYDFLVSMSTSAIWLATTGNLMIDPQFGNWQASLIYTYVKLAENASLSSATEAANTLLDKYYYDTGFYSNYEFELQNITDIHLTSRLAQEIGQNGSMSSVLIILAIALVVIVLAGINFVNLSTARSFERFREMSIRKVFGARRKALVLQLLTESVIMSLVAGVLGLVLVAVFLPGFSALTEIRIGYKDLMTLPFWVGSTGFVILLGVLAGLYPAALLSLTPAISVLRSRNAVGGDRFRRLLVVTQFVFSVVLIASLAVISSQLNFVQEKDLGYDSDQLVAMALPDPQTRIRNTEFRVRAIQRASIENVTNVWTIPGESIGSGSWHRIGTPEESAVTLDLISGGYDFMDVFGVDIVKGRAFSRSAGVDSSGNGGGSVIINESAVRALGMDEPVGQLLQVSGGGYVGTVVGVMEDFQFNSLHEPGGPMILFFIDDNTNGGFWSVIRLTSGQVQPAISDLENLWGEINPGYPFEYRFIEDRLGESYQQDFVVGRIVTYFSGLALLIATLGLLGLIAFAAARRRSEIGLRKALGASVSSIVLLLSRDFVLLVVASIVIAIPIVYLAMSKWLESFAYRVDLSWHPFVGAGLIVCLVAMGTVAAQALRAAGMNPVDSLRND